jgi:L-lactate dehydrogenase complex protein LldG
MEQTDESKRMRQKAEAVQTVTSEVDNVGQAFQYTVDLVKKQGGASIAAPGIAGRELSQLRTLCEKNGVKLLTKDLREHIGQIDVGFTKAEWGISETATLVVDSTSEDLRIATMLSETHVALVKKSRIVPDTTALEKELTKLLEAAPRYLAFISGASRTADIERVLTIGVHGPQELHMLILEEKRS